MTRSVCLLEGGGGGGPRSDDLAVVWSADASRVQESRSVLMEAFVCAQIFFFPQEKAAHHRFADSHSVFFRGVCRFNQRSALTTVLCREDSDRERMKI